MIPLMWDHATRKTVGTVTAIGAEHRLSNHQGRVLTFGLVGGDMSGVETGVKNSNMAYSRSAIQGARLGGM